MKIENLMVNYHTNYHTSRLKHLKNTAKLCLQLRTKKGSFIIKLVISDKHSFAYNITIGRVLYMELELVTLETIL